MKVLDQLAIEILTKLEKNRDLHVILPSERAKRYLLNALFRQNKGPMLAPNIQTIDQWVTELSPKKIMHPTRVLLMLFEVYQEVLGAESQPFEDFKSCVLSNSFDFLSSFIALYSSLFHFLFLSVCNSSLFGSLSYSIYSFLFHSFFRCFSLLVILLCLYQ